MFVRLIRRLFISKPTLFCTTAPTLCKSGSMLVMLLLKWCPQELLKKVWFQSSVHVVVALLNLVVHFGTIVGTMTAITSALVSFATVPIALALKTWWKHYRLNVSK